MSNVKSRIMSILMAVMLGLGCFTVMAEDVDAASKPGKPSISVTKTGHDTIKVSWKKVSGAKYYEVYASGGFLGSKYKYRGSREGTSMTIHPMYPGSTYKVKVKAVNGNKYTWSDVKSISVKLATPKITAKALGGGKVKITVTGKGYSDGDIYMSTSKGSGFKQKGWIHNMNPDKNTHTTTISKLTKGKTYYFKAKCGYDNSFVKTSTGYSGTIACKVK